MPPDITLAEIKEAMGLPISLISTHNAIQNKQGYQYKKGQYTQANSNTQMYWKGAMHGKNVSHVVFLDESGVNIDMISQV